MTKPTYRRIADLARASNPELTAIGHQLVKLGPTELVAILLGILLVSAIPVLWRYWRDI